MYDYETFNLTQQYRYYNGYMLDDVCTYELTDHDKMILDNTICLVENNYSLRKLSKEVGRSKSQLSDDFKKPLRQLSYELYKCVQRILKSNIEKYCK